ncbi:hypothetical protein [Paraburkholderia tropica]|uniref:hypothetical protein n=1 Tax=Paraburkholderia tropica TaxID=92647 RepID=UPI002AB67AA8|nr:hypothetical protein [Paraburkholderia tropica]
MPNRKPSRLPSGRPKALLLPMARDKASDLILRTRLVLERIRRRDIDRGAINHMAQICILSGYIARAGYGRVCPDRIEEVEQHLAHALLAFDGSDEIDGFSAALVEALTEVVNEYDHMLATVRLELFAKASDYLDHLLALAAKEPIPAPEAAVQC